MFRRGDIVELLSNPYAGMIDIPIGSHGKITRNPGSTFFVSVKFEGARHMATWPVVDAEGETTIRKVT